MHMEERNDEALENVMKESIILYVARQKMQFNCD